MDLLLVDAEGFALRPRLILKGFGFHIYFWVYSRNPERFFKKKFKQKNLKG